MMTQADLDAFLQRFESGQATVADRQLLRQLFFANGQTTSEQSEQAVLQLGKYGVNVREGQDVHIGDRYEGISPDIIQTIIRSAIQAFQQLQSQNSDINTIQDYKPSDDESLELLELNIDPQTIEWINSRLITIENLRNAGHLVANEQEDFKILQRKVRLLSQFDQDLQEIKRSSDRLLRKAVKSLEVKLGGVSNSQISSFSDMESYDCLAQKLQLLQQFQTELEQGQEIARWLDKQRSSLAEELGQHALEAHIKIKQTISSKEVEAFYFTVELLLERLSHCLTWGRAKSLKTAKVPVILDDSVYETAFKYLLDLALNDDDLPDEGVDQLREYVDYLIQNLPKYRHTSLG